MKNQNTNETMSSKEIIQAWANGEISFEMAFEAFVDEMPYGVQNGDEGTPEDWMMDKGMAMGVVFPE